MVNLKRTREDILESVIDTVHRHGLTATGLSKLFHLSGASSGSFYNYFSSKQDLGHALIDFEWEKLKANVLDPATERYESPIDQLFWILDRLEQKQHKDPFCGGCLLGNLIVDLVEQDASFRDHLAQVFNQWEAAIAERFVQAQEQLIPNIDSMLLARQIMTVLEGAMLMGKLHQDTNRLREGFDVARQLIRQAMKEPASLAESAAADPESKR
ncbi:TetR/AcrR family transcriptional regulator [Nodosilinea sp. P-1105]|uniref:TetR/AcrR family transcriptional regulator n=1 Tax=Nodosilinea sp. P-1105 TaxID=2546229 RepID=UPI00146F0F50|nr:TetR/AcrR family transcriptional regulator [Nodosilinea sp. P-1105]NMF81939.1 TetR/AcrR family transcriptional regulator [Nodosilinea sp. P-1105]